MNIRGWISMSILLLLPNVSGCLPTATIPTTERLSDSVMMGIKTNSLTPISFNYYSNVSDGLIKPCDKDNRQVQSSHPGFLHTENTTFNRVLYDYINMKFSNLDNNSPIQLKIALRDFWIEQYSPDSSGSQILAALGGGEINIIVVAYLDVIIHLTKDGKATKKVYKISSDSSHVAGFGTRTETSRLYRGKDSLEYRVADAINGTNTKAMIIINQFLESHGL